MIRRKESHASLFVSFLTVVVAVAVGLYAHMTIQSRVRRGQYV
jgi:hypothetical protein